jgi:arginase family enzyme
MGKATSKTRIAVFPFDLFGSAGTARGAELLADGLREMIADNARERVPTRARTYRDQLKLHEFSFEKLADFRNWRNRARRHIRRVLTANEFLLWVTGNHLGALPVYDEIAAGHPDTLVIQFDAHLDVYNLRDCTEELSHGNFLLHCTGRLPPLVNVGHRELLMTEGHIDKYFRHHYSVQRLVADIEEVIRQLRKQARVAARVFIDLDCDVFDSAYFPALSHPQPFGLSPLLFLRLLDAVWSDKVIGLSISEFDPARDVNDRCLALLLWLIEHMLLRRYETAR